MTGSYKRTLCACYLGATSQAVICNLTPLLFIIFQQQYSLNLAQLGFLVTYNFGLQILVDFLAGRYAQRIGFKTCVVAAHVFGAVGIAGLGIFPELFSNPYVGLLLAVTVYATGAGLIEVLMSPIVQALPLDGKSAAMSLMHSFYCWGSVLVVLLSTLFFHFVGREYWKLLCLLWALIPAANAWLFACSPIRVFGDDGETMPIKKLFAMRLFWVFSVLMLCSGASELAMSQWASFFAETGLKVSKSMGDLLGPCLFAVLMGTSRLIYGIFGERIPLKLFISASGILCVASYLLAVFAPHPVLSLLGCGICGLSVGIMWPGTLSLAAEHCPTGGAALFAMLAMMGDVGCSVGPSVVGLVGGAFGDELKAGLLAVMAFPLVLVLGIQGLKKVK